MVDIHGENVKTVSNQCRQILQQHATNHSQQQQQQQRWSDFCIADITNKNQVSDMMERADSMARGSFCEKENIVGSETSIPSSYASILVNAAGVTRDGLISKITEEDYDNVLNTNLKGTFLTCQAFCNPKRLDHILGINGDGSTSVPAVPTDKLTPLPLLRHSASIINIGSIISETGNIGQTNYAASKGGVIGLTRALAKEMAFYSTRKLKNGGFKDSDSISQRGRSNIRVNAILPGFIHTPMSEAVPDHVKERIQNQIPLKEFGTVDDIANMALFLASSRSSYVTGATLECSGMISL